MSPFKTAWLRSSTFTDPLLWPSRPFSYPKMAPWTSGNISVTIARVTIMMTPCQHLALLTVNSSALATDVRRQGELAAFFRAFILSWRFWSPYDNQRYDFQQCIGSVRLYPAGVESHEEILTWHQSCWSVWDKIDLWRYSMRLRKKLEGPTNRKPLTSSS